MSAKLTAGTDESEKIKFAFEVYDINKDGYISNGELFQVMKMMVGNNLTDQQVRYRRCQSHQRCHAHTHRHAQIAWSAAGNGSLSVCLSVCLQLQQLVDRTMLQADIDGDGMISYAEFKKVGRHCTPPCLLTYLPACLPVCLDERVCAVCGVCVCVCVCRW